MTARVSTLAARSVPALSERWAVPLVAAAIMAAIVLPTAIGPLGPIDDHEIVRISRGEWLPLLEGNRFRPVYWIGRNLEGMVWGANPAGWAFDRALLGVLTIALGYALARRYVGPQLALLAGLLVVVGPQAEAFYRLGPQESYGVPLVLGSILTLVSGHPVIGLALAVVAAFTKETFTVAAVGLLAIAWWLGYRRPAAIAACFVTVAVVGVELAASHGPPQIGGDRNLLPWIIVPIGAGVWLARRRPQLVAVAAALLVVIGAAEAFNGAAAWARQSRDFAVHLAYLRTVGEPLIVHAGEGDYERALTLPIWLPGTRAMLAVDEPCRHPLCEGLRRVSRDGGFGYEPLGGPGISVNP